MYDKALWFRSFIPDFSLHIIFSNVIQFGSKSSQSYETLALKNVDFKFS